MRAGTQRIVLGVISVSGLAIVFLFQHVDVASAVFGVEGSISRFIVNRSLRFILNDSFAVMLIYALFRERKYVLFSIWVQLAGMLFLLFPYFIAKVYYPNYNGPLISFIHRLILNPTLLLLLIPAFYFQRNIARENRR